jgi:hypothetical protein
MHSRNDWILRGYDQMLHYAPLSIGLALLGLRYTELYSSWPLAGYFAGLPLHPLPIQLQVTTYY